jgi:hypothetical protein
MPARCFLAFAVLLCVAGLQADTREVVRIAANGHETTYAQYVRGAKIRTENLDKDGSRPPVTIENPERRATYMLDPSSRKYIEQPWYTDWILPLAQWIARPPRVRKSNKRVDIYYEVSDTGERQQFFGRTARHLLLRERHVAEPGACERTYEIDKDGWYLPRPKSGKTQISYRLVSYIGFAGYRCQDIVIKHGDSRPPGFAVRETTDSITREVLDFSDAPLDESLFEVPSGFQKVDRLPRYQPPSWYAQWQWEWAELERAVESWFE